jgi:hypothetical protein
MIDGLCLTRLGARETGIDPARAIGLALNVVLNRLQTPAQTESASTAKQRRTSV